MGQLSIKNYFFIVLIIFIAQGCIKTKNLNKKDSGILHFMYMSELEYDGRVYFRTRVEKNQLDYYKNLPGIVSYFKVYHKGFPVKVEEYDIKTNRLKKIYLFDKNVKLKRVKVFQDSKKIIDCKLMYFTGKKIEECDNGVKTITYLKNNSWTGEDKIKNGKIVYRKRLKDEKVYVYDNKGKIINRYRYWEPDNIPVEIPANDRYPWL